MLEFFKYVLNRPCWTVHPLRTGPLSYYHTLSFCQLSQSMVLCTYQVTNVWISIFCKESKAYPFLFWAKNDCAPLAWGQDNTFTGEEHCDAEWLVLFEEFVGKWQKVLFSCSIFFKGRGITKLGLPVLQANEECRSHRSPWPGGHDLEVTTHLATFPQVGTKSIL